MKIQFNNLGAIKQAQITLGDFTVICGANNSGKTYVTYATYGFLDHWQQQLNIEVPDEVISKVMSDGEVRLPIAMFADRGPEIVQQAATEYSAQIATVFAAKPAYFSDTQITVEQQSSENYVDTDVHSKVGSPARSLLEVNSEKGQDYLTVTLLVNRDTDDFPSSSFIKRLISMALFDVLFKHNMPRPYIASAERTGAAIFQKELDFTRSRLMEGFAGKKVISCFEDLLSGYNAEYPTPVKENVDFIRDLPNVVNKESFLVQDHPDVLARFSDIIGGDYQVSDEGAVQFKPEGTPLALSMVESSSAVRSLLDIGFYLRHEAQPGDILMVDEPELNLHPENQRKVARLLAMLVNHGIKVFITTHSDTIVRELNTLLLLNGDDERLQALATKEGYLADELLDIKQVKVYMSAQDKSTAGKYNTLIAAPISDKTGIELASFDQTIETLNRIQDEIIWGD